VRRSLSSRIHLVCYCAKDVRHDINHTDEQPSTSERVEVNTALVEQKRAQRSRLTDQTIDETTDREPPFDRGDVRSRSLDSKSDDDHWNAGCASKKEVLFVESDRVREHSSSYPRVGTAAWKHSMRHGFDDAEYFPACIGRPLPLVRLRLRVFAWNSPPQ
jgi:hypothetical protein